MTLAMRESEMAHNLSFKWSNHLAFLVRFLIYRTRSMKTGGRSIYQDLSPFSQFMSTPWSFHHRLDRILLGRRRRYNSSWVKRKKMPWPGPATESICFKVAVRVDKKNSAYIQILRRGDASTTARKPKMMTVTSTYVRCASAGSCTAKRRELTWRGTIETFCTSLHVNHKF